MYKRKFWLDMENLLIHFTPHKDPTTKLGCLDEGSESYNLRDISEVRDGYQTDIFNKIDDKSDDPKFRKIKNETAFSLIFSPESNMHELDLVAEDKKTRDVWVETIKHLVITLKSLSHQKEYELFLKNKFRAADANKSGYLNFEEIKDLCKGLNIQLEKEELKKLFNRWKMNTDHLEHSLASRQPVPHHSLHERLAFHLLLLVLQHILHQLALSCGQFSQQLLCLFFLEVHDGVEHHVDGVKYIHAEGSLVVSILGLAPLLCLGVEEGLSPEFLHHLSMSTPNFEAYISANCFRVKAQPWRPDPNPTEPLLTSTRTTPMGPSSSQ